MNEAAADWEKRTTQEIDDVNEKSDINFYGIVGILIAFAGLGFGLFTNYLLFLAVPLGLIVAGIGDVLKYLRKMADSREGPAGK